MKEKHRGLRRRVARGDVEVIRRRLPNEGRLHNTRNLLHSTANSVLQLTHRESMPAVDLRDLKAAYELMVKAEGLLRGVHVRWSGA